MRRRPLFFGVLVISAFVAAAAGFAFPVFKARAEANAAVGAYQKALAETLARLDPSPLAGVASQKQRTTVTTYVTYLWGSGVYMDATLLASDLLAVKNEGGTVAVTVLEDWRYEKRDRKSRRVIGGAERSTEKVVYRLVRQNGRLVVDSLAARPE